jgi:hypothetical protein
MPMTVTTVVLQFDCAACEQPVRATLKCEGELDQLTEPPSVPLQCPHCRRVNNVSFDLAGEVVAVATHFRSRGLKLIWN